MNSLPKTEDELRPVYDDAVSRLGKSKAVGHLAEEYGVSDVTVRRLLADLGIRGRRKTVPEPAARDLAAALSAAVQAHGERASVTRLAESYGVTTVTIRQWLKDCGLRSTRTRIPARPITAPCPCGAVATTRYKGQDPPLCFTCYMRTYAADKDSKFRRAARQYIADVKAAAICADCAGKFPPCVYHFDHVPERGEKLFNIGNGDYAVETVKTEIAKCDIVCANCHAIRTWMTRDKHWQPSVADVVPRVPSQAGEVLF